MPDDLNASTLRPDGQLFSGGGAKRVGRDEQHRVAAFLFLSGKLTNRRGLAGTVNPDDQHDVRRGPNRQWFHAWVLHVLGYVSAEYANDIVSGTQVLLLRRQLELLDDLFSGADAKI